MGGKFNGTSAHDHRGPLIGSVPQKKLVPMLRLLTDVARSQSPSATRDQARETLRLLRDTAHWETPFVLVNIGLRRRRYLAAIGWTMEDRWLADYTPEDMSGFVKRTEHRR